MKKNEENDKSLATQLRRRDNNYLKQNIKIFNLRNVESQQNLLNFNKMDKQNDFLPLIINKNLNNNEKDQNIISKSVSNSENMKIFKSMDAKKNNKRK